jgi:hypothetical protein
MTKTSLHTELYKLQARLYYLDTNMVEDIEKILMSKLWFTHYDGCWELVVDILRDDLRYDIHS